MRKLGMLYAMAMMFAGQGMVGSSRNSYERRPQPRKLNPEEMEQELEKRKTNFLSDLQKHNEERRKNFPKFKEFEVHGLTIIAFSLKNATRDINFLAQNNLIEIKTN